MLSRNLLSSSGTSQAGPAGTLPAPAPGWVQAEPVQPSAWLPQKIEMHLFIRACIPPELSEPF